MPFQPGQSGNPNGRKGKGTPFADMLRIAIKEAHEEKGGTKLRAIADKLVEEAIKGNVQAIREVADRLDQKPAQQQIISGDPDAPLQTISKSALSSEDWALRYGIAANQD